MRNSTVAPDVPGFEKVLYNLFTVIAFQVP
jgi:hypothetical protein